jgi:hypothetical protein
VEKVSSVTVGPASGQTPMVHSDWAHWAVRLAEAAAALVAIAYSVFGIAYAVGGSGAIEDNWVAVVTVVSFFGGLLVSLIAFAAALAVRVKHLPSTMLWLPLALFPALVLFVVLGEAFWWE